MPLSLTPRSSHEHNPSAIDDPELQHPDPIHVPLLSARLGHLPLLSPPPAGVVALPCAGPACETAADLEAADGAGAVDVLERRGGIRNKAVEEGIQGRGYERRVLRPLGKLEEGSRVGSGSREASLEGKCSRLCMKWRVRQLRARRGGGTSGDARRWPQEITQGLTGGE